MEKNRGTKITTWESEMTPSLSFLLLTICDKLKINLDRDPEQVD